MMSSSPYILTPTTEPTATIPTTIDRAVRFADKEVSAVFYVPRKTENEAFTLFYQPSDVDRFRAEARWEKLALEADLRSRSTGSAACSVEKLNDMSQLARRQFRYNPLVVSASRHMMGRTAGASSRAALGCACIA